MSSSDIVRRIESTLRERRIPKNKENKETEKNEPKLIIHNDRGRQYSSDTYFQFTNRYKDQFRPSMSPMASSKHNSVMERFIRTFKELKINDLELGIVEH
jgi:transposase InsO family protein